MFFAPFLGTANVVRIFLINKVINNLLVYKSARWASVSTYIP